MPDEALLGEQVQRINLQNRMNPSQLPPALASLPLIVLYEATTPQAAQALLTNAQTADAETFQQTLNWVEAILANKFPRLPLEEVLKARPQNR